MKRGMQHSDIAEADDPFRPLQKHGKVQELQQVDGPVAAPCAPNGFHRLIVQGRLQVGRSFFRCARLLEPFSAHPGPKDHLQAPALRQGDAFLKFPACDGSGRGDDGDGVAWTERWWNDHAAKVAQGEQVRSFPRESR